MCFQVQSYHLRVPSLNPFTALKRFLQIGNMFLPKEFFYLKCHFVIEDYYLLLMNTASNNYLLPIIVRRQCNNIVAFIEGSKKVPS